MAFIILIGAVVAASFGFLMAGLRASSRADDRLALDFPPVERPALPAEPRRPSQGESLPS